MADIVNLRQARKQKERAERERAAARNRAVHGRTKAEREREAKLAARLAADLDGHRRDPRNDSD